MFQTAKLEDKDKLNYLHLSECVLIFTKILSSPQGDVRGECLKVTDNI